MRQEYHYTISRTDRICLIVFVLALLGWELIKYAMPKEDSGASFIVSPSNEIENTVKVNDETVNAIQTGVNRDQKPFPPGEEEFISPIEIMQASVEELKDIGLSGKVAFNIKKYLDAGGRIRDEKDLMKIYGMDSSQLNESLPYIIFPQQAIDSNKSQFPKDEKLKINYTKSVDLNVASASDFEALPGIGAVLADRIIKFRDGLAGFFNVDQLKECYGLPLETFEKIRPSLIVTTPPARININEIDLTNFSHPYLPKKFPRMIKAYKDQHGPFKDASELRKVYPPDSMWCEKILPYLRFE